MVGDMRARAGQLDQRPDKAPFDTHDQEVSVHNDVDDQPDRPPSALGRVRGPG